MSSEEAQTDCMPLETSEQNIKSGTRRNTAAISACLLVISILCACNMLMYNSYINLKKQMNQALETAQAIKGTIEELDRKSEKIRSENAALEQNYNNTAASNEELQKQINEIRKQNEGLISRNKELIDDNIALQNSLKRAAAAGVKPQSYKTFEGLSSRSSLNRGTYMGKFLGTAYTPSNEECGNNKGITNSGEPIIPGISIAVDSKYWPFGTVFYIKGLGYAVAMDTGSAIKGKNRFDFAVFDKKFADTLGKEYWDVYLIRMGNGKLENIKL